MPETRCAVYTRKSAEDGLEQASNSLHAQREACVDATALDVGEQALEGRSGEGGVGDAAVVVGGVEQLPALVLLAGEVGGAGLVYKVDRLTRSLADFARIIETFDARNVAFVSITQQLNTTTSMRAA